MEDMSDIISEFSKIIEKNGIPDNLKDLIGNINNNNDNNCNKSNNSTDDVSSFNLNNIDIKTFLKIKNALDKLNSMDNPNTKLLLALKPYLKDNKKEKIDQYIKLMNISSLLEVFNKNEGDKNDL